MIFPYYRYQYWYSDGVQDQTAVKWQNQDTNLNVTVSNACTFAVDLWRMSQCAWLHAVTSLALSYSQTCPGMLFVLLQLCWCCHVSTTLISDFSFLGGCIAQVAGLRTWKLGTSLVKQWLRIRLPMQGTWVRSLVREDPTCCEATKPVCHNYCACTLEPTSHNYWARAPQLLKPAHPRAHALQQEKPPQWEAHALQRRPKAAKNK